MRFDERKFDIVGRVHHGIRTVIWTVSDLSPKQEAIGMTKWQFAILATLFIGTQGAVQFAMQYVVPHKIPLEWEYRTYYLTSRDDGKFYGGDLSEMGGDGWELVSVVPAGTQTQVCLFKRPVFGPLKAFDEESDSESFHQHGQPAQQALLESLPSPR